MRKKEKNTPEKASFRNLHFKKHRSGKSGWYFHKMVRGRRIWMSLETDILAEALVKKAQLEGNKELTDSGLISDEIERYMAEVGPRLSEVTLPKIRSALKRLITELEDLPVIVVTPSDARRYAEKLKQSVGSETVRTYLTHAKALFGWCQKIGLLLTNPFDQVDIPAQKRRPRQKWVRPWDSDRLIEKCTRPDLKFVLLAGFHAGMRRNEIVHARPEWFDWHHHVIHISLMRRELAEKQGLDYFEPKDRTERSIPLSEAFEEFAKGYVDPAWDYCIGQGRRKRRNAYRYDFRRPFDEFMAAQGFSWVTIHGMRHSFIGTLYSSGKVSTGLISEWTGDREVTLDGSYKHVQIRPDILSEGLRGVPEGPKQIY